MLIGALIGLLLWAAAFNYTYSKARDMLDARQTLGLGRGKIVLHPAQMISGALVWTLSGTLLGHIIRWVLS